MVVDNGAPKGGLGTIRNATLLMDLLARSPYFHQLTDLAQQSGMTVPTVHRLLRSLVYAEYAVQDPATSRYGLGQAVTRLAVHQMSNNPILTALSPFMIGLRDQLDATIAVHVLIGGEAVCIDQAEARDRGPFRRPLRSVPALESAAGRILAAHAGDEVWESIRTGRSREPGTGAEDAPGGPAGPAGPVGPVGPGDPGTPEASSTSGTSTSGTSDAPHAPTPSASTEAADSAADMASRRSDWRSAEHVVFESADPTASNEVAVPVRAADGVVVAALSADLQPTADPHAVAASLLRTAASCGRSISHG